MITLSEIHEFYREQAALIGDDPRAAGRHSAGRTLGMCPRAPAAYPAAESVDGDAGPSASGRSASKWARRRAGPVGRR